MERENIMISVYSKIDRLKMFIKYFFEKYQPICCICGNKLSWKVFFPKISGCDRDDCTIHHLDHNRANDVPENWSLCHRECHRRHHRNEQLFRELNPDKKFSYEAYLTLNQRKKFTI